MSASLVLSVTFAHGAAASPAETNATAGYAHLTVSGQTASRGDASNLLDVVVWYPAAGTPARSIDVGPPGNPYFSEGVGARDAAVATSPGRFPFVVVSHGTGGTNMDLSWLCAGLASRGFVVAAVTHPGNNALEAPTVAGSTLWWLRAEDLSRTIDGVLADPRFGPRIDRDRIGAAGFSLGGYTVLALAGIRADVARLDAFCAAHPESPTCSGVATPTIPDISARARALAAKDPAYRAALAENAESHRDSRVRAVFAISPALGPAIVPASLGEVTVPVSIVDGMADSIVPVEESALPDALAIPNAALSLFPRPAGHYTFLTNCTPAGAAAIAPICEDSGPARIAVHAATVDLAGAFFSSVLRPSRS
jgi:predicted dienelactone hydrolase